MSFSHPAVCAVIARTRHKMVQAEIKEAGKQGAKLIELRLDFLSKAPDFRRLLENRPCPIIATIRRPAEGGRWSGTEDERMILIRQAVVAGFDYIDLETDIADKVPRFGKVRRIVSFHDMRETPDNLEEIFATMCKQDADILKIAVTAQQVSDNLRVLKLVQNAPKPTIAFCMGELGVCSRFLALKLGSPFTYAAFNPERTVAPGMLSFREMQKTYSIDRMDSDTKIFGVVGDPIGHSLSPILHNLCYRKMGLNAIYIPFRVPRSEFHDFVEGFTKLGVAGLSATIPHKEAAAANAETRDAAVERIGAANTLVATETGTAAYNTDAQAAIDSLRANLPLQSDGTRSRIESRTVLIVGAGGVARAIAHALQTEGAAVTITNRTEARAEALATEVGCKFIDWNARHSLVCDSLINCTSVGMHPNVDDSPIHHSFLKPGLFVFDTIYRPEMTLLLREAKARECQVLSGVDMFVRQAAMQIQLFTGIEPHLESMTKAVRKVLSPLQSRGEDDDA